MIRPMLALLVLALGSACSPEAGERTAPPTGQVVYLRHCASCHGREGRGDGPVAASLARPPSDLTRIARRNGGEFDESAVMAAIDGERVVAEHGPRDMPVWGVVFEREHSARREPWPGYIALLEVRSLVDYLRSIQQP